MKLIRYDDPKVFWENCQSHLLKDAAVNNLMLGLSKSFIKYPERALYQIAVTSESQLLGAAICNEHIGRNKFVVSPCTDPEVVKLIWQDLCQKSIPIHDIIADRDTALLFKDEAEKSGSNFDIKMRQGIYRCSEVTMPKVKDGFKFDLATEDDLETVAAWTAAFFHDVSLSNEIPKSLNESTLLRINTGSVYTLRNEMKEIVSLAGWGRDLGESCAVNFVYTPNKNRGQGYGSLVTALLTDKLLKEGRVEIHLYTDLSNPTSNKIYQKIGYNLVADGLNLANVATC